MTDTAGGDTPPFRNAGAASASGSTVAARMNRLPVTSLHRLAIVAIGIGFFFDLYESFLSGILAVTITDANSFGGAGAGGETAKSLLLASVYIGSFFGAVLMSRVADRVGRRTAFLATLAVYSVFSLAGAFSTSVWMLIAARFLAGVGIGAELPLGAVYLADLMPPRMRGRAVAWAFTAGFCGIPVAGFAGSALQPTAPLGMAGWRWMLVFGAIGAVIILALRRSLPESPRWLESAGRQAEAERTVALFEDRARLRVGELPIPRESPTREPKRVPLRELFTGRWRNRTVMLWIFHLVQTVGYYGFGTMVPLVLVAKGYDVTETLTFTALTYVGYPIGSLASTTVIERIQRKWLVVGAAAAMVVFGLVFGFAGSVTVIVISGFLYTISSNVFSNAYHAYEVEMFPTQVRATAAGTAYSLSRITNASMPFLLVPLLHDAGAGALFAVIVAAMVVVIVDVSVLGPRTTGLELESINPAEY